MGYLVGFAIVLALVFGAGWFAGTARTPRAPRLERPQRRELLLRREEHEKLIKICLDSMDVEPYARLIYTELTNTQKEIDK